MVAQEPHVAPTRAVVAEWMVGYITGALDITREDFSTSERFDAYGFDSAELVIMAGVMEEEFNIEINPEGFFETPTTEGVLDGLVAAGVVRTD